MATMKSLTAADEQQLLDGVRTAVGYVDQQGLTPTEAMRKVAEEQQFSPGFLRAAVSAFNNGRQVAQWRANSDVMDKLATYPLADYNEIHAALWGSQQPVKAAGVSSDYALGPTWETNDRRSELLAHPVGTGEKTAETLPSHIQDELASRQARHAINNTRDAWNRLEAARSEKVAAEDRLQRAIWGLRDYFRKFAVDRLPFNTVEEQVRRQHDAVGQALMNHLAESFPREKRAADTRFGYLPPPDWSAEPYAQISQVCDLARSVNSAQAAYSLAVIAAKMASDRLTGCYERANPVPDPCEDPDVLQLLRPAEKQAGVFDKALQGVGLHSLLRPDTTAARAKQQREVQKIVDTMSIGDHSHALDQIRAQTLLARVMSDPDNVVSGYSPDEVVDSYNTLSQLTPTLSTREDAVKGLLGKRLTGRTEPFEVKETVDIEKLLASQLPDVSRLPSATDGPAKPKPEPKPTPSYKPESDDDEPSGAEKKSGDVSSPWSLLTKDDHTLI